MIEVLPLIVPAMTFPFSMRQGCVAIDEDLFPDADVVDGGWTPATDLHLNLDSTSSAEFATSVVSGALCSGGRVSVGEFEVAHTNPTGIPGGSDCQGLRVRVSVRIAGADSGTGCGEIDVEVREGATLRLGPTTFASLTTGFVQKVITFSDANYDNISDHDNLRVLVDGFPGHFDEKSGAVHLEVSFTRLEYFTK